MAVTAIHPRARRGPSSFMRSVSLLALVVAWAAVFGAAYVIGSRSTSHTAAQSRPPALASGSSVPASASATVGASGHATHRLAVSGLHPLPAPPALRSEARVVTSRVVRAPVYYVPAYRPAVTAPSTPTPPAPTGGGPHGSGGTGGGTTTVGGSGTGTGSGGTGTKSGGGSLGTGTGSTPTTPTGTTPTTTTPTPPTPAG